MDKGKKLDSDYQYGFSDIHSDQVFDVEIRRQKANKILAVLEDYFLGEVEDLSLLDVGCSSGIMAQVFDKKFNKVVGVDIDSNAVRFAAENFQSESLKFSIQDSMNIAFPDSTFDVVVCAHIYEHVPDARRLLSEIHRVLKSGGVCYFEAGSRLNIMEPHYRLPFLSIIPKPLAHLYLRIAGRGDYYYEKHLTLGQMKKLVSQFDLKDYTLEVVRNPEKYHIAGKIRTGTFKQKLAILGLTSAYWLFPTFIWVLSKRKI